MLLKTAVETLPGEWRIYYKADRLHPGCIALVGASSDEAVGMPAGCCACLCFAPSSGGREKHAQRNSKSWADAPRCEGCRCHRRAGQQSTLGRRRGCAGVPSSRRLSRRPAPRDVFAQESHSSGSAPVSCRREGMRGGGWLPLAPFPWSMEWQGPAQILKIFLRHQEMM